MNEIRLASLACDGAGGIDASVARARKMIAQACSEPLDLICLPETFAWGELDLRRQHASAETLDGPVMTAVADAAKQHSVNLLVPILERDGDTVFNTAIWFDRRGSVLGKYRKVFPTDYELTAGTSAGPVDFDVFATEFGPIGCCICFDINFRQIIERIVTQHAKLILFPTAFQGLALMRAWARLYGIYFVAAAAQPYAAVVDPIGRVLIQPWEHDPIMRCTLNLDYAILHTDHNSEKVSILQRAYGEQVAIEKIHIESTTLLASKHPSKSAVNIAAEFDIETEKEYLDRSASRAHPATKMRS